MFYISGMRIWFDMIESGYKERNVRRLNIRSSYVIRPMLLYERKFVCRNREVWRKIIFNILFLKQGIASYYWKMRIAIYVSISSSLELLDNLLYGI